MTTKFSGIKNSQNREFILDVIIPMLIFSAGFIWRCFYLSHRDLCLDEPFTLFHAQERISDIIKLSVKGEPNPPLFILLLHFWIKTGGTDITFARLLPLIFSNLTAVFLYLTGKRFYSLTAGILASLLLLFSNFHFFHSIEIRTYSLLSFAVATTLYYFLRIIHEPENKKLRLLLIVSNLVLVYSHHFGWFIVMMQMLSLIFYLKNKAVLKSVLVTLLFTVLAYSPFFIVLIRQFLISSQGTWVEPPDSGNEYFIQLINLLNHREIFNVVAWFIVIGAVYSVFRKNRKTISKDLLLLFLWWFLPFTIMFLMSYSIPVFITRYLLFNSIALYLFIAASVNALFNRHKIIVPVLSLIILIMMVNRMRLLPNDFSYREVKNATLYVKRNIQFGDIVILYPYWSDKEFSYYYDRAIFSDPENFADKLAQQRVFPVYDKNKVESVVNSHNCKRVFYYSNGPGPGDDDGIFRFLSEKFTLSDSAFYPQTISVTVFKEK